MFFRQEHQMLAADDVATMLVIDVRTKGNDATALVGFRTEPVGKLRLRRETTGSWKLASLLDVGLGT